MEGYGTDVSLDRIAGIAQSILERTSDQHWKSIDGPRIEDEMATIASLQSKLREAITEHNAFLSHQYDGEEGRHDFLVHLSQVRNPDMNDVTTGMRSGMLSLHGCVVRSDVPDEIVHAHVAAILVEREVAIMSCLESIHDPCIPILLHAHA